MTFHFESIARLPSRFRITIIIRFCFARGWLILLAIVMTITPRNEYKEKVQSKMPYLFIPLEPIFTRWRGDPTEKLCVMQCWLKQNTSSKTEFLSFFYVHAFWNWLSESLYVRSICSINFRMENILLRKCLKSSSGSRVESKISVTILHSPHFPVKSSTNG